MAATYLTELILVRFPYTDGPNVGQPSHRVTRIPNMNIVRDAPDAQGFSAGMVYNDGQTYGVTMHRAKPNEYVTVSDGSLLWVVNIPQDANLPRDQWTYRTDITLVHTLSDVRPASFQQFNQDGVLTTFDAAHIYMGDPANRASFRDVTLGNAKLNAIEQATGETIPRNRTWTAARLIKAMFRGEAGRTELVKMRDDWDDMSEDWVIYDDGDAQT